MGSSGKSISFLGSIRLDGDKHDAEWESQRQSLEDLKTEVSLLTKRSFDTGRMSCDTSSDTASTVASASQSRWCPQNVRVRGGVPLVHRTPCRTHFLMRAVCQLVLSGNHPSLTFHALARLKMKVCGFSKNSSYFAQHVVHYT